MKKFIMILFISLLLLSACGQKEETNNKNEEKAETTTNKVGFKNDIVTLNKGSIKILDVKIRNASDETNGQENIIFTYEAINKTDEDFSAQDFWVATMEVYQENKNTNNKLEVGSTPTTGKYEEYFENMSDTIKKNGKAKGVVSYVLEDDNDVTLKAIQGNTDKELGKKTYKLSELEKIDHSTVQDIQNQSNHIQENEATEQETTTTEIQQPNSVAAKQESITKEEYDRTKTTTHDESQISNPKYEQYQQAQQLQKDIDNGNAPKNGVGGGPGMTSPAGESFNDYQSRVQSEMDALTPKE